MCLMQFGKLKFFLYKISNFNQNVGKARKFSLLHSFSVYETCYYTILDVVCTMIKEVIFEKKVKKIKWRCVCVSELLYVSTTVRCLNSCIFVNNRTKFLK